MKETTTIEHSYFTLELRKTQGYGDHLEIKDSNGNPVLSLQHVTIPDFLEAVERISSVFHSQLGHSDDSDD